ncbi:unnamed protein product [Polarella glacialis]|uniref:Uncharacterized protein n=1 Tax=Polarella glacialis TaxID=89957 RepID=A0A813FY21_POLGL|nr:unnamed protein product [Polarella glacialis]
MLPDFLHADPPCLFSLVLGCLPGLFFVDAGWCVSEMLFLAYWLLCFCWGGCVRDWLWQVLSRCQRLHGSVPSPHFETASSANSCLRPASFWGAQPDSALFLSCVNDSTTAGTSWCGQINPAP